jgi:hypothetical protein
LLRDEILIVDPRASGYVRRLAQGQTFAQEHARAIGEIRLGAG